MKVVAALGAISIASAISDTHLKLTKVECTPGVSGTCITQCTDNGCYNAKTDGQLNACLERLDATCSVHVEGEVVVTLDKDEDFCNVGADGFHNNGWVIIIPYMGNFARMQNPILGIPAPDLSAAGTQDCSYLSNEIGCKFSENIATISGSTCSNPTISETQRMTFNRLYRESSPYVEYEFAVLPHSNTAWCMPKFRECWAQHQKLMFSVEFEHDFFGQSPVITDNIVASGNTRLRII